MCSTRRTVLAARIAVAEGHGETVLLALTGAPGCHRRSRLSEFTRLSVAAWLHGPCALR